MFWHERATLRHDWQEHRLLNGPDSLYSLWGTWYNWTSFYVTKIKTIRKRRKSGPVACKLSKSLDKCFDPHIGIRVLSCIKSSIGKQDHTISVNGKCHYVVCFSTSVRVRHVRTEQASVCRTAAILWLFLFKQLEKTHTNHRNQHDHKAAPLNVALNACSLSRPSQTTGATFEMPPKNITNALWHIHDRCAHTKKIPLLCSWLRGIREKEAESKQPTDVSENMRLSRFADLTESVSSLMPLNQMFGGSSSTSWRREERTHRTKLFSLCHSSRKVRRRRRVRRWSPS